MCKIQNKNQSNDERSKSEYFFSVWRCPGQIAWQMYATRQERGSKGRKGRSLVTCEAKKHCNPRAEPGQNGGFLLATQRGGVGFWCYDCFTSWQIEQHGWRMGKAGAFGCAAALLRKFMPLPGNEQWFSSKIAMEKLAKELVNREIDNRRGMAVGICCSKLKVDD